MVISTSVCLPQGPTLSRAIPVSRLNAHTSIKCILKYYESIAFALHKVFSVHVVRTDIRIGSLTLQYMLHAQLFYLLSCFINMWQP